MTDKQTVILLARLLEQGDLDQYWRDIACYGTSIWEDVDGKLVNVSPFQVYGCATCQQEATNE